MSNYLYTGTEWNFDTINRIYDEVCNIGEKELKLDWYPNQFEIVDYRSMLDVYASHGMPVMYNHWSFGKNYIQNFDQYSKGYMGLALEMVINTNPCINYLLDENTATGQALVIAHAAIGHNSFFKNNYLFKQWTSADFIIDYLIFAKKYIAKCEEQYGAEEVEYILDAAHSLMMNGVDKYKKPKILSAKEEEERAKRRAEESERNIDEIWNIIPKKKKYRTNYLKSDDFLPNGPEENLLYFLEKKSPTLRTWEREILRIVRKVAQYFYPNYHTKTINEGWASTVHYYIMNRLYDKNLIDEGSILEFLKLHTSVVYQPSYDSKYYSGFNPYHLGFNIFKDIKRISQNPTDEDRTWNADIAGGDWVENWKYVYENYRDDSFIQQFLSPNLIREMKLFSFVDDNNKDEYLINRVHDERGYRNIKNVLSSEKNMETFVPDIQVTHVDFDSRMCYLTHYTNNGILLDKESLRKTIENFSILWGFAVSIETYDRNKSLNAPIAYYSTLDEE